MEREDMQPKILREAPEVLRRELNETRSNIIKMLNSDKVQRQFEFDKDGNKTSVRIFGPDGELIYYKDIKYFDQCEKRI